MTLTLSEFVGAAAGGALGAALGALAGFALMGTIVIATTLVAVAAPSTTLIAGLAFGPVFGPHVLFAAGAAAAAYAARRRALDSGRDIASPLIGVNCLPVLGIGALFGVLGQLLARVFAEIPPVRTADGSEVAMIDGIAVSVVLTALLAGLLWGRTPLAVRQPWLPWQHTVPAVLTLGAVGGGIAGSVFLAWPADTRALAGLFLYGVAALSLLALVFGKPAPVTHHIVLPAALAAGVATSWSDSDAVVLGTAVVAGMVSASVAEGWSRVALERSRVHLDPPAVAIAVMATLLAVLELVSS